MKIPEFKVYRLSNGIDIYRNFGDIGISLGYSYDWQDELEHIIYFKLLMFEIEWCFTTRKKKHGRK